MPPSRRANVPPKVSPFVLLWSMVVVVDCLFRIDVDDYLIFDIDVFGSGFGSVPKPAIAIYTRVLSTRDLGTSVAKYCNLAT